MLMKLPGPVQIFIRFCLQHLGCSRQLLLLDGSLAETLDLPDTENLFSADKGKGASRLTRTAGSADPVHIIFIVLGQVIINDHLHIIHIDPPGSHIRSNENIRTSVPESPHRHIAQMLGHVTMQSFRLEACFLQHLRQFVHLNLRIAEDQPQPGLVIFQQTDTGGILILAFHLVVSLRYQRNGQFLRRHSHQPGILLKLIRNVQNRPGHGSGEKGCLMLTRDLSQDQLHILPESHIQHLIRFVQNHHVHMVQLNGVASHMIHHPSRRAHNDLGAPQSGDLLPDLLSSVHRKHLNAMHIPGDAANLIRRLHCQFSGGTENNGLEAAKLRVYLLQGGDGKSGCLSRSRLGLSYDVFSFQQIGNGLYLNGGKLLKTHFTDCPHDPLIQQRLYDGQAVRPSAFLRWRMSGLSRPLACLCLIFRHLRSSLPLRCPDCFLFLFCFPACPHLFQL